MKIRTIAVIAALLLLTLRPAFALGFKDAAEKLLYFEYASLSTVYCEQRGYPSRSAFSTWQQKYVHVQRESAQRILAEGESRGSSEERAGESVVCRYSKQQKNRK